MNPVNPPKFPRRLLEWWARPARIDDLLGDMEEWFTINARTSVARARWRYWKQTLSILFSYTLRYRRSEAKVSHFSSGSFSTAIIASYFKVAARNLYRHRYFSLLNAGGLAIGMSVMLLFLSFYIYVTTFDNFHVNRDTTYRIVSVYDTPQRKWELACAPISLTEGLKRSVAGVKQTVNINSSFSGEVIKGNLEIPLRGYYTESSFLEMFTFPLRQGDARTALTKPNSAILSESAARKLFNSVDVLGKMFEVKGKGNFEVTGVMIDPPANSHLVFETLISFPSLPLADQHYDGDYRNWFDFGRQYVYVQSENRQELQRHLDRVAAGLTKQTTIAISFELQPLGEITPGRPLTALTVGLGPQWDRTSMSVFGGICLLILLPACFNYTNISIARALKRAKEIGLRKTIGGHSQQIFFQFIVETIVITSLALCGAFVIFYLIRPEFKSMMVSGDRLDLTLGWRTILAFAGLTVFTGFTAGFFPALHFARLNPVQALKNQSSRSGSRHVVRKSLTVFQFALSFCFILAIVVFSRQYRYSLNFDFGFQRNGIVDVPLQSVNADRLKNEFEKLSFVKSVAFSSDIMGMGGDEEYVMSVDSHDSINVSEMFVDAPYIDMLQLKFIAGSNFADKISQQENSIVVNEQFVRQFKSGTPLDALGKVFLVDSTEVAVVGVVKDFNYSRLSRPIAPFMFRTNAHRVKYASVNFSEASAYEILSGLERSWRLVEPVEKFDGRFFDDELRESYSFYETLLKLVGFLGLLAVSISLLGLLGMVVYNSETRAKEVGIRKVMGATTSGLTVLLSKQYFMLMLIAAAIAIPGTTLIADSILSGMQYYHVTLGVGDIALSFAILMMVGLITIAIQTFRTASTNPATVLRTE